METIARNTFGAPAPRDNVQVESGFGWLVNFAFEAAADCLLLLIIIYRDP